MVVHLDVNDERYPDAAERILQRHDLNEAEANITSAIRDFLILTILAKSDEIVEEKAPALGARTGGRPHRPRHLRRDQAEDRDDPGLRPRPG